MPQYALWLLTNLAVLSKHTGQEIVMQERLAGVWLGFGWGPVTKNGITRFTRNKSRAMTTAIPAMVPGSGLAPARYVCRYKDYYSRYYLPMPKKKKPGSLQLKTNLEPTKLPQCSHQYLYTFIPLYLYTFIPLYLWSIDSMALLPSALLILWHSLEKMDYGYANAYKWLPIQNHIEKRHLIINIVNTLKARPYMHARLFSEIV